MILDQYITNFLNEDKTVQECSEEYALMDDANASLLMIARKLHSLKTLSLSPAEKMRARDRLIKRLPVRIGEQKAEQFTRYLNFEKRFAWKAIFVAIFLLVSFSFYGLASAVEEVLPGQPLYSVKLLFEEARIRVSISEFQEMEFRVFFANNRITEMNRLLLIGDLDQAGSGFESYEIHMARIMDYLSSRPSSNYEGFRIYQRINEVLPTHLSFLEIANKEAPEGYRGKISRSIKLALNNYQRVLELSDTYADDKINTSESEVDRSFRMPMVLPKELHGEGEETPTYSSITSTPAKEEDSALIKPNLEIPLFEIMKKSVATLWPFIPQRNTALPTSNRTPRPPFGNGTRVPATVEPTMRPQLVPLR